MPVTERDLLGWMKPEPSTPEMQAWADQVGRGDYEIYSEKLNMILDEAREIFVRIGVSGMLHSGDLIVGIYTPGGDMAVASCGTYLHAVSGQLPVKYVIRELLPRPEVGVHDGDVFYCNDARAGGIHNPDQIAIMPVFHDGRLIAWTAAAVHQPETGACEPGGMPVTARSRYDEGMRLLPFKLVDRFQFREDILDVMANMVGRAPRMQIIDTRARVTACDRIRTRLLELVAAKGPEFLQGLFSRMIREAEGGARRRIREWNDGVYQAVAFLDTIGWTQRLLRVSLALHKRGDTIRFDFTGTSPENDGSFNAFAHIVAAHCAVYLYAFAFPDLPISSGTYAPLEFIVPEGSYLNAGPDAAVSNSPSACMPVCAVTNVAFSKLMFDSSRRLSVTSPMGYATAGVNFAGLNQSGVPVSDIAGYQLNTSGGGARSDLDGVDALGFTLGYYGKAPDLEDVEREYPFLHLYQRFRRDSGGMGKYRGGCGTETAWMIHLAEHFVFQSMSSHSRLPSSSGLFGGYPAAPRPGLRVLHSDIHERLTAGDPTLPRSSEELLEQRPVEGQYLVGPGIRPSRQYDRGDVFVGMTPGGTGYGDVLDRDPSLVMEDLRRGLISSWTAENVCKVVYDPASLTPDLEATVRLRDLERQARLHRGVHYDEFVATWLPKSPPAEVLEYFGAWPTGEKVRDIVRL
jgi:acetophenone carboxylase